MTQRHQFAFYPIESSAPAFNSTALGSTAATYALESTGAREWDGPGSRAVHLNSIVAGSYYVLTGKGSSVVASTDCLLLTALERDVVHVPAGHTHISFLSSFTQIVNCCLGYGI